VDVGQYLKSIINLAAVTLVAFLVFGLNASLPNQAEARIPAPQTVPVIDLDTPLARDANTFDTDKALDATCRKSGQKKSVCLCVTHIMKYELTLSEYRAATRLYGQSGDRTALKQVLRTEGTPASDIAMAEQMERSLLKTDDFAIRCSEAKSYYKERR